MRIFCSRDRSRLDPTKYEMFKYILPPAAGSGRSETTSRAGMRLVKNTGARVAGRAGASVAPLLARASFDVGTSQNGYPE